jgi:TATA-box binding protein (TBP) (component of TFIID and TFIIIB)
VGTKSLEDSRRAIAHFKRMITAAVKGKKLAATTNDDDDDPSFKVQNIVASGTFGQALNLPGISPTLPYNPVPRNL